MKRILKSFFIFAVCAVLWAGLGGLAFPAFAGTDSGASLAAKKTKAKIHVPTASYQVLPDQKPFKLKATTNSTEKLTYRTSNKKVATVSRKGKVKIKGVGKAKIIIAVAANKKYTAAAATVKITVKKEQILTPKKTQYVKKYTSKDFKINVKSNAKPVGKITYTSSDPGIVRVDKKGLAKVKGVGEATVTIRSAETKKYYAAETQVTVVVNKGNQNLKVKSACTVGMLNTTKNLNATVDTGLPLQYASSDKKTVKVSAEGLLTPVAVGTATITVSQSGNEHYNPASKTVTVTVRTPTDKECRKAAVDWAIAIAQDDSFAYGVGDRAHRYGCYFCKTNTGPKKFKKEKEGEPHYVNKKGKEWKSGKKYTYTKTYCCNPFVHAAYAHGAKNAEMLAACKKGSGAGLSVKTFTRYGCWENLGKPGYDQLQPGDVFLRTNAHASIYCGNDYVVEAEHEGWDADTIVYHKVGPRKYDRCSTVLRYTTTEQ